MLHLVLLGTPALRGAPEPLRGAATQRKPLALLALLATAGERGFSRDKLVAYLWPEASADAARHALRQLLHVLRRDLDAEGVFLGGSRLRLDFDLISADVTEFEVARLRRQLERAVALYGGPFLDGFFLKGAPEFELWVEAERAAFDRAYTETLGALAAEAASRGEVRRAAEWWRRLAEHEPASTGLTLRAMTALAAAGDRAGALQQARIYQRFVQHELEASPSPAVIALESALRHATCYPPLPLVSIAVLPLAQSRTAPAGDELAEGLVEELARALARTWCLRVVAQASVLACRVNGLDARELGRRLEAELLLQGSIRQSGERVRLTVQLVDAAAASTLWSDRFERRTDDVFALQDQFTECVVEGMRGALGAYLGERTINLPADFLHAGGPGDLLNRAQVPSGSAECHRDQEAGALPWR